MISKDQIFAENSKELDKDSDSYETFGMIDNTPLKRAKEMYSNCIEKAKVKHSSSTSRTTGLDKSDYSIASSMPPRVPSVGSPSIPEAECLIMEVDLLSKKAKVISPNPVRLKLVWLKESEIDFKDLCIEGGTEKKKSKDTFYERMFKIDTKTKGKSIMQLLLQKKYKICLNISYY